MTIVCELAQTCKTILHKYCKLAEISYTLSMTMKAAQEMAEQRWKGVTKKAKKQHSEMMAEARLEKTTPEQRTAAAKKAAAARWAGKKRVKKS